MSAFEINPCKHLTDSALIDGSFPAIKSTDNKPTPMVPSSLTLSPYARALRNEHMVGQELDSIDPDAFRTELVKCLVDYYEKIRDIEGAGGLRVEKSFFKRKFKEMKEIIDATVPEIEASSSQTADGNDSTGEDAQAGEVAAGGALEAAAAGAAAPAPPAPPAARAAGTAAGDYGAAASTAPVKKGPAPRTKGAWLG
jgi:hypothetical protein